MWTRVVRVATAGFVLAGTVVIVGVAEAEASYPGSNGRLVYAEDLELESGVRTSEIYTMNPDGSDVRQLTFDAGQEPTVKTGDNWLTDNYSPVWSPRGDMIAYVHRGISDEYSIRLMDPNGNLLGTVTEAFRVRGNTFGPVLSWSPDGKQLAFLGSELGDLKDSLWVIGIDGHDAQMLVEEARTPTSGPTSFGYLAWSPKGDLIAFRDLSASRKAQIHVIEPDGSGLRPIGNFWNSEPEWSPDGDTLYGSAFYAEIWSTLMPDASSFSLVAVYERKQAQPTMSPDGTEFLFVSEKGGEAGLWRLEPLTRLGDFTGSYLDWQPLQGSFWDDEDSVFKGDIEWMADSGITKGCNPPANDMFCPDSSVTRGQMAAFLVRALKLPAAPPAGFTDTIGTTFEKDIDRLAAAGITKGCNPPDNDRFCPDDKVRRGVMAAFLVRALKYTDDGGGDLFIDDDSSIFETDIDKLATAGVTKGCNPPDNDRFCPTQNVTRGQMAAFLHRALS